jgi:hypothetical protein
MKNALRKGFILTVLCFQAQLCASLTDFSHLPTELLAIVTDVDRFSQEDHDYVLTRTTMADRISDIESGNTAMRNYMHLLTAYEMNEWAMTIFDANGTGQCECFFVEAGLLDDGMDTLAPSAFGGATCNDNVFKQFIGVAREGTLSAPEVTAQTDMYTTLNDDLVDTILARKERRVVHPLAP